MPSRSEMTTAPQETFLQHLTERLSALRQTKYCNRLIYPIISHCVHWKVGSSSSTVTLLITWGTVSYIHTYSVATSLNTSPQPCVPTLSSYIWPTHKVTAAELWVCRVVSVSTGLHIVPCLTGWCDCLNRELEKDPPQEEDLLVKSAVSSTSLYGFCWNTIVIQQGYIRKDYVLNVTHVLKFTSLKLFHCMWSLLYNIRQRFWRSSVILVKQLPNFLDYWGK